MSDTVYKVIPKNPNFSVSDDTIKKFVSFFRHHVAQAEISWQKYENPTFIDCGENFTFVSCPYCNQIIPSIIWGEMMDGCYENGGFENLKTITRCCNSTTTLNELNYDWECGFARFVIEILNPENPPYPFIEWQAKNGLADLKELEDYRVIVARI